MALSSYPLLPSPHSHRFDHQDSSPASSGDSILDERRNDTPSFPRRKKIPSVVFQSKLHQLPNYSSPKLHVVFGEDGEREIERVIERDPWDENKRPKKISMQQTTSSMNGVVPGGPQSGSSSSTAGQYGRFNREPEQWGNNPRYGGGAGGNRNDRYHGGGNEDRRYQRGYGSTDYSGTPGNSSSYRERDRYSGRQQEQHSGWNSSAGWNAGWNQHSSSRSAHDWNSSAGWRDNDWNSNRATGGNSWGGHGGGGGGTAASSSSWNLPKKTGAGSTHFDKSGGGGSKGWVSDWLPVSKFGAPCGPFVCLKTPCDPKFDNIIAGSDRFRIEEFLTYQRDELEREISLIINLANTQKYYSWDKPKMDQLGFGEVEWWHSPIVGRTVPSARQLNQILDYIHATVTKHPSKFIAIHCTHGVNRTAFFVMAYMLRYGLATDIADAKAQFEKSRGEEVQREYLLDGLRDMMNLILQKSGQKGAGKKGSRIWREAVDTLSSGQNRRKGSAGRGGNKEVVGEVGAGD